MHLCKKLIPDKTTLAPAGGLAKWQRILSVSLFPIVRNWDFTRLGFNYCFEIIISYFSLLYYMIVLLVRKILIL